MKVVSLTVRPLTLPFRVSFKHSSAERRQTLALLARVETEAGSVGLGEGCPRAYVTGEDLDSALRFCGRHKETLRAVTALADLETWLVAHAGDVAANPAAACALELALLEALAKDAHLSVEQLLAVPALGSSYQYTAVLGDAPIATFSAQTNRYAELGFRDFKLKASGDARVDGERMQAVLNAVSDARLRLDANNLWSEPKVVLDYLAALPVTPFALEEPLRALDFSGLEQLARHAQPQLILDESFLSLRHFEAISAFAERAIINLRVSKMGGLLRSLAVAQEAQRRGLMLVIGAQVGETTLLTRAALTVASAFQGQLIAQEGAFGTALLASDIVQEPLMFSSGGILEPAASLKPELHGFELPYKPEYTAAP